MSRVRPSVRPSNFFIREKHPKPREHRVASACVYLNDPATGHECQRHRQPVTLGRHRLIQPGLRRRCMHVCVRACACVRASLCDVFAIYDNNSSPRLIMIIITIILLYFIQIRQTDDFPSTGTRLVRIHILCTAPYVTQYCDCIIMSY